MRTKIVYCLVSDNTDYYYEQLLISLCSLRKHNPDATVEVVCDNDTFTTLKGTRGAIYDYGINVIPVETPVEWAKFERSRYLKTNLRKLTRGDYLYIDTDTVICTSLDFVDGFSFNIGAVKDGNIEGPLPKCSKGKHETERWIWEKAKKIDVNIAGLFHYNSGVMYVKDSEVAYELYSKWWDLYCFYLKSGIKIDQFSLLLSNGEMKNAISALPNQMNCLVYFEEGRDKLDDANIVHYFPNKGKTVLSSPWVLDYIKETGKLSASIQRIVDNPRDMFRCLPKITDKIETTFLRTSSLVEAYTACPKVFNIWLKPLNAYLAVKKWLYNMIIA